MEKGKIIMKIMGNGDFCGDFNLKIFSLPRRFSVSDRATFWQKKNTP